MAAIGQSKDIVPETNEFSINFNVTETFKGGIDFERITSNTMSCGKLLKPGVEYLVFATAEGETRSCVGTQSVARSDGQISKGNAWVETLRAHSNEGASLDPPWQFFHTRSGCMLIGETPSFVGELPKPVTFIFSDRSARVRVSKEFEIVISVPKAGELQGEPSAKGSSTVTIGQRRIDLPNESDFRGQVRLSQDRNSFLDIVLSLEQTIQSENDPAASDESQNRVIAANWRENSTSALAQFRACVGSR